MIEEELVEIQIQDLLREMFEILDRTEESDEGRIFRTTTITSIRVMDSKRLNEVLNRLKELVNLP